MDVMSQLEGAYALLVKSIHYPGEMVACKRGSPLIMGVKKPTTICTNLAEPALVNGDGDQKENGHGDESSLPVAAGSGGVVGRDGRHPPAVKRRPGVEYFLASDASAVVEHTKRVVVLEDGDVVAMRKGTYEIFNFGESGGGGAGGGNCGNSAAAASAPLPRALQTLNMEVSSIMKGGYDHFMLKEIFEQPETVLQTMRGRVKFRQDAPAAEVAAAAGSPVSWLLDEAGISATTPTKANGYSLPLATAPSLAAPVAAAATVPATTAAAGYSPKEERIKLGGLAEHIEAIRTGRRLIFVACGTSYHACLAARQALEHLVGIPVSMELASDLLDRYPPIFRDDTCVFVSQSGETADTLHALEYAKAKGALCVGLTNTVGSAIARSTHCGVHINAGCEIGVASTKAYTSQIVVMVMMALALSADRVSQQAQREEIIDGLGQLPCALRASLRLDAQVRALAERLKDEQSLLVFGRGYNYATALEAALKVKEVTLMHSEGILAGEMKHGPLALVDEHMPILVVATSDGMHGKMLSVIQQLKARGARLLVLCCEGDAAVEDAAGNDAVLVRVPRLPDCLQPVVNAVPLQLLAYHLAVLRGHNVDQPRNLAKSVTTCE
jgi:glucosamine 6-phosphate synthetase-like amidotransferase/phosphosugar isomerase protein